MLKFLSSKTWIVVASLFLAPLLFSSSVFATNSISMSVSSDSVVLDLIPKSVDGTFAKSDNINISVSMSGAGGYTLGIKSATTGANSTKLINTNDNSKYFSSITSAVSEDDFANASNTLYNNKWGYNPNKYHSADNTSFRPAPDENGDVLDSTSAYNASGDYTISIGARANINTTVGEYSGTVIITAIANVTCNPNATTIGEAICMQDMNDSVINSMEMGTQYRLMDNRDGKQYYIAKMKDGRVWMTQNLDLDLETTPSNVAALTSENTDLNTFGSHNYTIENGYTCSNSSTTTNCTAEGETITWAPINATQFNSYSSSYSTPSSTDVGGNKESYYYVNNDGSTSKYYSLSDCEAEHSDGLCPHYHLGNYYNWTAAVASNYTSGIYTNYDVMENSICPAGWRLPYGRTTTDSTNMGYYSETRFTWTEEGVFDTYNSLEDSPYFPPNGWLKLRQAPIYMVGAGAYNIGDVSTRQNFVYLLTNTVYSSTSVHIVRVYNEAYVNFGGGTVGIREDALSIRCIARQDNTGSTTVSFDKNAGDAVGTMNSQTFNAHSLNNLSTNSFTRSGYTFKGWNTKADGSGDDYSDGGRYYAMTGTINNTVTLYAQWEKLYTITFNTGSNASSISFDGTTYTDGQSTQAIEGHTYVIGGNYPIKYGFNSWNITGGTVENINAPATYYTVTGNATISLTGKEATIDMTTLTNSGTPSSNCKNEAVTPQLVYDPRDNEAYWVAQLCDGNIWMLDNLRLDLTNSTVINGLNSSNTNASDTLIGYLKNGGGASDDQYPTSGLTSSQWTSYNYYSIPKARSSYKNNISPIVHGLGSGKIGVYYNYCAASSGSYCWGNGTQSTNSPTTDPNTTSLRDIEGDICPIGWHMPTGGNNNNSEYKTLYASYNGAVQEQKDAFLEAFSINTSGGVNKGSRSGIDISAIYLSSTWSSTTNMRSLGYQINDYSDNISTNSDSGRVYGYQVRCVRNNN